MDFVMNMAQNMHKYEPSDYITAHYIQQLEYNEQVSYTLKNLVLNEHNLVLNHTQAWCLILTTEHNLVLNHTQAWCLILTTQACVVLTQDHVFCNTTCV